MQRSTAQNLSDVKLPDEKTLVGRTVSLPDSLHLEKHTVLLFVRPGCTACTANMGFYRSLMTTNPRHFRVVAIGSELLSTKSYLGQYGVQPDEILAAGFENFGVFATPTILLSDQKGKVGAAWVGTLEGPRRDSFLRSIE